MKCLKLYDFHDFMGFCGFVIKREGFWIVLPTRFCKGISCERSIVKAHLFFDTGYDSALGSFRRFRQCAAYSKRVGERISGSVLSLSSLQLSWYSRRLLFKCFWWQQRMWQCLSHRAWARIFTSPCRPGKTFRPPLCKLNFDVIVVYGCVTWYWENKFSGMRYICVLLLRPKTNKIAQYENQ